MFLWTQFGNSNENWSWYSRREESKIKTSTRTEEYPPSQRQKLNATGKERNSLCQLLRRTLGRNNKIWALVHCAAGFTRWYRRRPLWILAGIHSVVHSAMCLEEPGPQPWPPPWYLALIPRWVQQPLYTSGWSFVRRKKVFLVKMAS